MRIACRLIVAFTIERKTQTEHVHREDDGSQFQCEIALHDRYFDLIATASQAAPQPAETIEPERCDDICCRRPRDKRREGGNHPRDNPEQRSDDVPRSAAHKVRPPPAGHPSFYKLLVSGSLARAPSKECGRCLLTKFGLAQFFTARLFWRFGEQWHPAVNIFDALSPHTVAASDTRPIHTTRHNALSRNTRVRQQSRRGKSRKNRRLCLSAPDDGFCGTASSGLSGPVMPERFSSGPTPLSYTRASRLKAGRSEHAKQVVEDGTGGASR